MAKRPVEKYDFKAFGEAIKAARTGRKESRKQVSDEMYISPRYLANIENKGQHPSLQIFFELIEKGSFHVLLDVADFGGVFLHTVQYKADMFAVQFHKFCFYKLCRVVVPGDTDCSSFGADGFKNKGKDFLYPVPVKVSVLYQIVVLDIVLDDFLIHAVCVCRFLSLPFRQLCRVL